MAISKEEKLERLKKIISIAERYKARTGKPINAEKLIKLKGLVEIVEKEMSEESLDKKVAKLNENTEKTKAELEKSINGIELKKGDDGKDGKSIKGDKGTDGKDGINGKDGKDGKDGTDGKDGKEADEKKIVEKVVSQIKIPEIEKKIPELGEPIRESLESLKGDERLEVTAIKGLEDKIKELEGKVDKGRRRVLAGPNANAVQYSDLTSQCNGVLKTFAVPNYRKAIALLGTQFPIIYRPIVDYTSGNKTITLTSEVSAPETGQTLTFLYIK